MKKEKKNLIRSRDDRIVDAVVWIISLLVLLAVLYPLIYILSSSFSEPNEVALGHVTLLPRGFTLEGYQYILDYSDIWIGYRNTIFYTVVGTLLNLACTLPAAYALSRRDMFGNGFFTALFAVTMFFSGGLIPTYLVYKQLGIINTVWVMLLPGLVTMWNTVVCRTYFSTSIPWELQEASKIDGCGDIRLFASIILPLSAPIIAVMAMFYAVSHWNAYFNAMIYLSDKALYPLQLFLRSILLLDTMNELIGADAESQREILRMAQLKESMKYGIIVVSALPMLVMYPFFQKYFVKGVMVGAIKG
ncbi:carbohydrate ABC transporter permease [Beduinella massiliensis]|uniref:carbohydrate ABC transporter permease n=1 Tax=Beduinella massiliensis TaxID=1852363 RepID=UPI000C85DBD6